MAGKAIGAVMLVLLLLFFGAAAVAAAVASLNPFSGPTDTTGTPSSTAPSGAPATPGAPTPGPGPAGSVGDIPAGYLVLYQAAARQCPGLHWAVLAAVGKVETNHGRSTLPGVRAGVNPAGARVIWS